MATIIRLTTTITLTVPDANDELVPKDIVELNEYANDVLALVMCQTATPDIVSARHFDAEVQSVEVIASRKETTP